MKNLTNWFLPELILAEMCADAAVRSPTDVEINRSLLRPFPICQHEQSKWTECTSAGGSIARAAIVSNVGLDCVCQS